MTSPRSPRATPRRLPPDAPEPEKRRAILHAAVRVFAEKGYHGCRIADVARGAGVAYGLVYHYFQNKDELLESVFAEQWTILLAALKAIQEGPGTASEKIAGVLGFVLDVFKTAPTAVRVLILEVARTPKVLRSGLDPGDLLQRHPASSPTWSRPGRRPGSSATTSSRWWPPPASSGRWR